MRMSASIWLSLSLFLVFHPVFITPFIDVSSPHNTSLLTRSFRIRMRNSSLTKTCPSHPRTHVHTQSVRSARCLSMDRAFSWTTMLCIMHVSGFCPRFILVSVWAMFGVDRLSMGVWARLRRLHSFDPRSLTIHMFSLLTMSLPL